LRHVLKVNDLEANGGKTLQNESRRPLTADLVRDLPL
jgi:hypothetical protein